jgi:hypothetical protein
VLNFEEIPTTYLQLLHRQCFLPVMISAASKNASMSLVLSFAESAGFSGSGSGDVEGDLGAGEDARTRFKGPGPGVIHMLSTQQNKNL